MSVNAERVQAVFLAAAELEGAADRARFLDGACDGDAELRARVEALLRAHDEHDTLLDQTVLATDNRGSATASTLTLEGSEADTDAGSLGFLAPATRSDSLGRIGHYEVLQVIGKGGFGIVFRAFDDVLHRIVGVKVLSPELAATSPARKRFLREARSSAQVRHQNVIQVYEVGEQPLPYIAMEFIPGETLQQRLDRTGPLDVPELLKIGRQIAEGLAAAHTQGLIHRDIKPGNILIESSPSQNVKITDFGLARAADDASISQSGIIAGTPMYMAPEQAQGDKIDHRADLFSLGSVLYTMASGRPPFRANSTLAVLKRVTEDTPRPIPEIIPEVPQWICDLISRLHAKNPEDRLSSAREVADLLGQGSAAIQQPGNVASPPVIVPAAVREGNALAEPVAIPTPTLMLKPRSHTIRWATAAAGLLILLGGFGVTEATGVTNFHGTVIRLFSPEGTLVVEVDDPGVSVKIDGSDIVITGAGAREIRLKPGSYTVEATKDGKVVSQELVTVAKNGKQVVRVRQEPRAARRTPNVVPPLPEAKDLGAPATDSDRLLAEYVLSIGGAVTVNEGQAVRAVPDLPPRPFYLTGVNLNHNSQVSDEGLAVFERCKNLKVLNLIDASVGDVGLAHFKDCKNLKVLNLHRTKVTDAGLAFLEDCQNLDILWLEGTQVGDAGLAHLKGCKNLTQLGLPRTKVTGVGLAHLKDNEKPWSVTLTNSPVTDAGLAHLKDCKKLSWLGLANTKEVTDAGLAHLKDCKDLTYLNVQQTRVSQAGVDDLKETLQKCRIDWDGGVVEMVPGLKADSRAAEYILSIGGAVTVRIDDHSMEITRIADLPRESFRLTHVRASENKMLRDAGLSNFRGCKNLRVISLGNTQVGDAGLADLKDSKDLEGLHVNLTPVTDAGVAALKDFENLTDLTLAGTRVTDDGLMYLKGLTKLKTLELYFTPGVTGSGLAALKDCKDLTSVNLYGTPVTDVGLAHVKDCTSLTKLTLAQTQITDVGLAHLKDCKNLKELYLKGINLGSLKVTAGGIDELKTALPKCKIEWDGGVIAPR